MVRTEQYRFCSGVMSRMSLSAWRKNLFPSWSSASKTSVTSRTSRIGSNANDPLSTEDLGALENAAVFPSTSRMDVSFCSTPSSKTWTSSGRISRIGLPFLSRKTMSSTTSCAVERTEGEGACGVCWDGPWAARLDAFSRNAVRRTNSRFMVETSCRANPETM